MSKNPFTLISTKKVYENPWISVREDAVLKPNGSEWIFGIVSIQTGANVIIIDESNNIYLNLEYSYGLGDYEHKLPWWGIDPWETPLEWAKREILEEVGIIAHEWISLGSFRPLTSVLDTVEHIFLARDIERGNTYHESGEVIKTVKIPYRDALEMVMKNEIIHASSIIAILKAQKYLS